MDRSDQELVEAARAGDRAATEELLARHEQRIYRFGLRMCGDEESAKEVLQAVNLIQSAFTGFCPAEILLRRLGAGGADQEPR